MKNLRLFALVVFAWGATACTVSEPTRISSAQISEVDGRIFITDRTGKKWDVTHAVEKYGFKADRFEFGLGPNAIPPILTPKFFSPGEPGYPPDDADFLVMGVALHGQARAYSIADMSRHEVADETFGSTHVAVAY